MSLCIVDLCKSMPQQLKLQFPSIIWSASSSSIFPSCAFLRLRCISAAALKQILGLGSGSKYCFNLVLALWPLWKTQMVLSVLALGILNFKNTISYYIFHYELVTQHLHFLLTSQSHLRLNEAAVQVFLDQKK